MRGEAQAKQSKLQHHFGSVDDFCGGGRYVRLVPRKGKQIKQ